MDGESFFPEAFARQIEEQLGTRQARLLLDALDGDPVVSVRYNPYKTTSKPALEPVPWSRYGFYLPERPSFTLDPSLHGGAYYVPGGELDVSGGCFRCRSRFRSAFADTRPVRGSRRQDDASFEPGRSREPDRRERAGPRPGGGPVRQRPAVGDRECRRNERRSGPFRSVRALLRPDSGRRALLGRGHVPQGPRVETAMERVGSRAVRGPATAHSGRSMGRAPSRRHADIQHLHVQPGRERAERPLARLAIRLRRDDRRRDGSGVGHRARRDGRHRHIPLLSAPDTRRGLFRSRRAQSRRQAAPAGPETA